jgi:hypothetical protein
MVVIRDQAVTWSDGSLGCPQPGVFYTQALVPGYWVVLQVGDQEYDYRASERGHFVLCEGGGLPFTNRWTSNIFGLMQGGTKARLSSARQKRPAGVIKVSLSLLNLRDVHNQGQ